MDHDAVSLNLIPLDEQSAGLLEAIAKRPWHVIVRNFEQGANEGTVTLQIINAGGVDAE